MQGHSISSFWMYPGGVCMAAAWHFTAVVGGASQARGGVVIHRNSLLEWSVGNSTRYTPTRGILLGAAP
jgi:hypothetical protein